MAITYKNARVALGTTDSTVYTCPGGVTAIVLMAVGGAT